MPVAKDKTLKTVERTDEISEDAGWLFYRGGK